MKRYNKITAGLLAAVMALSLAACGSKKDEATNAPAANNNTPTPTAAATVNAGSDDTSNSGTENSGGEESQASEAPVTTPAPTEPPFEDGYEAVDLGKLTIKFAANYDELLTNAVTEPPEEDAEGYEQNMMKYENTMRVMEKYNMTAFETINIKYESIADLLSTSVFAGDPFAHIIDLDTQGLVSTIANNFIMKTKDYMLPNADALNNQDAVTLGPKILGDTYSFFPTFYAADNQFYGISVNLDILNTLGVASPVDLYEEGNWTWDTFFEIAKAATKDTDGDGVNDQFGYGGTSLWTIYPLIHSNGGYMFDADTWKTTWSTPRVTRALEFVTKLVYEEKVWPSFGPGTIDESWNDNVDAWKNGKCLMGSWRLWFGQAEDISFSYAVVPFPKGPDAGDDYYYPRDPRGLVIPVATKNATPIYQIYEELQHWYGNDISLIQEEQQWIVDCFQDYDSYLRISEFTINNGRVDIGNAIPGFNPGRIWGPIMNGESTIAQSIEANNEATQEAADELLVLEED